MNNRGFTLIELLVVVLIIGVLTAVALPKYNKAVEKSRAGEGMSIVSSLGKAAKVFAMAAGGDFPSDIKWGELDWRYNVQDQTKLVSVRQTIGNWSCRISAGRAECDRQGGSASYTLVYIFQGANANNLECEAYTTEGQVMCITLGCKPAPGNIYGVYVCSGERKVPECVCHEVCYPGNCYCEECPDPPKPPPCTPEITCQTICEPAPPCPPCEPCAPETVCPTEGGPCYQTVCPPCMDCPSPVCYEICKKMPCPIYALPPCYPVCYCTAGHCEQLCACP